jgi:hypothetical protein
MILYIEIVVSYIILYDMTTLNIVTRYNGLIIVLCKYSIKQNTLYKLTRLPSNNFNDY